MGAWYKNVISCVRHEATRHGIYKKNSRLSLKEVCDWSRNRPGLRAIARFTAAWNDECLKTEMHCIFLVIFLQLYCIERGKPLLVKLENKGDKVCLLTHIYFEQVSSLMNSREFYWNTRCVCTSCCCTPGGQSLRRMHLSRDTLNT